MKGKGDGSMKRTPVAAALRIHCAERTRAMQPMQLACMCALCASILAPYFSQYVCVWKDMRCKLGKRLLTAGLAVVMTAMSVCGCGAGGNIKNGASGTDGSGNAVEDGNGQLPDFDSNGAAMGRYLEETIDLSEHLEGYRNNIFKLDSGKLIITEPMAPILVSEDNGTTWTPEENDWLTPILKGGGYINSSSCGADGTMGIVYTLENGSGEQEGQEADGEEQEDEGAEDKESPEGSEASEDSFQEIDDGFDLFSRETAALIVKPDGTQIPVQLPAEEEEMLAHIWIKDDGRTFAGTEGTELYEVREDGNCEKFLTLETSPQRIIFQGNRMIIDGYDLDSLLLYDMDSGEFITDEVLDTFVKENYGDRTFNGGSFYDLYFFAGEEDVIYLAGDKGVHRHVIGGGAMEQIIDGNLSTFGNPSYHLLGMTTLENNEFMAIFTDARLVRYVYDPTVPTVPSETVKAYSLTENNTLRQAISLYQTEHPEAYVEYEIGMEENSSVTREDALKKLNTKIMAGEGPDVLILDGMPVDSYIEKGLLADISPMIDSMEGEEKLFDNVVDAFRKDGRIYTIPCGVELPTLLGREKYVSGIQDLEDIADAVEALRADMPGKDLLRVCSEKGIMRTFGIACAPAWKTESGEIDPEAVAQFLTQTKRIYEAQMEGLPEEVTEDYQRRNEEYIEYYGTNYEDYKYFPYGMDDMNYTMGGRQLLAGTLGYSYAYAELTSVPRTKQFADSVMIPMDGQSSHVFCANTLAGISAASENREHAEGLLRTLLGPEDISAEGFPVNQAAFEDTLFPDDYVSSDTVYSDMAYMEESGKTYVWLIYWFDEAQTEELRNRMKTVDTPYVEDDVLEEAVYQAGTAYMRGEMSLEEAVADVEKNMAIYMAE